MIIKIKNLRLKTIIGVHEWEEHIERNIIINATIEMKRNFATQSDNIEDTVDYDIIVQKIKNIVTDYRFKLIEKMAHTIISEIMKDSRILKSTIEIDKINVIDGVDSFSVIIEQNNGS